MIAVKRILVVKSRAGNLLATLTSEY